MAARDENRPATDRLIAAAPVGSTVDAVAVSSADGTIAAVNTALARLVGCSKAELVGAQFVSLFPGEWSDFAGRQQRHMVEAGEEVTRYECAIVDRAGNRIPVEVTSALVRDGDETIGVRDVIRDTRDRSATERRLRESEERFLGAFEGAAIGMALVATDGRWLKVNHALTELLGYSTDELLGLTFQALTHPDDLDRDLESVRRVLAGDISWYHMEKRYIRKDGELIWGLLAVSLVRDTEGRPAHFVSQVEDITDRKQAEIAAARIREACGGVVPSLSRRETEVLGLLADGLLTSEAAAALGIGDETVQTLVRRAMRKLGARNRTQAVASALRLRLLDSAG